MSEAINSIAIIGAGKLGITLAQLALNAGYYTKISASGDAASIALTVDVLAPGAVAVTNELAAQGVDVVILAIPLSKFKSIPPELFAGKTVIDAMNYWWEVDGDREHVVDTSTSSSESVQQHFSSSVVVKAFNHIGYHDLFDWHRPKDSPERKAVAYATDNESAASLTATLIDSLGFDPLYIGKLHEGRKLEPGSKAFGANVSLQDLWNTVQYE